MRLLIQDDIINKMDVYVEYTIDEDDDLDPQVILFDYGLELTARTVINGLQGREGVVTNNDMSLRGYVDTRWVEEELIAYIELEEGLYEHNQ